MTKIAFFVEGQTEQIFVNRLVKEIMGSQHVTVIQKKVSGGTNAPKHEFIRSYSISKKSKYTILINDCGSDNRVKSEIIDNIFSLRESGYKYIIGLRDLYPLSMDELPLLKKGLKFLPYSLKDLNSPFDIVVAVQEVETWFLGEPNHFFRIDRRLTGRFIEKHLGFNPYMIDPSSRKHPSEDLDKIYKLIGKSYTKKYWQVEKIVNKLDFNIIRHELRRKLPSLDELISAIESAKSDNDRSRK